MKYYYIQYSIINSLIQLTQYSDVIIYVFLSIIFMGGFWYIDLIVIKAL